MSEKQPLQSSQQTGSNPYAAAEDPYDYDYQPFNPATKTASAPRATQPQGGDEEGVRIKALELAKREAELEKREAAIRTAESQPGAATNFKKPNWPRCYPLVYHNVLGIESKLRRSVAIMAYVGWFMFIVVVVLNFITAMVSISPFLPPDAGHPNDGVTDNLQKAKLAFMSALIMIISIPAHFFISYFALYKSMETVHILRFLISFVTYALPIIFCGFGFAGWYEYGVCGLILVITAWPVGLGGGGNIVVWVFNVITMLAWAIMGIYFLVVFVLSIYVFRKENHTMKKAQALLKSSVVTSVTSTIAKGVSSSLAGGGNQAAETQV